MLNQYEVYVHPQPSPEAWMPLQVGEDEHGNKFLVLQVQTVLGNIVHHLSFEAAETKANEILSVIKQAKTGIVLPPPGFNVGQMNGKNGKAN